MPKKLSEEEIQILRRLNGEVSTNDIVAMLFDLASHLEGEGKIACAKVVSLAAARLDHQTVSLH